MSKKWVVMSQVALGSMLFVAGYLALQRRASRRADQRVKIVVETPLANVERLSRQSDLEDLDDAFSVEPDSAIEPTVLSVERSPVLLSAEDGEAPAPEELGERWLAQATATESSSEDPLYPNVEELAVAEEEVAAGYEGGPAALGNASEVEDDSATIDDDETTRDYIRKHRISSIG